MKKYAKKLLALVMVLAMAMSLGVSAYALNDTAGSYVQDPLADVNNHAITGTTTVYLSIVSDRVYDGNGDFVQIERYNIPVTLMDTSGDGSGTVYYVSDVLNTAKQQYSWLKFYSASGYEISGVPSYLYGIKDTAVSGSVIFQPAEYDLMDVDNWFDDEDDAMEAYFQYLCNGWMFRINDKMPLLDEADWPTQYVGRVDYCGAPITQAYVEGGDSIVIYFADIYNDINYDETGEYLYEDNYPTEYVLFDNISLTGDTLTANVYSSIIAKDPYTMDWVLDDVNFVPTAVGTKFHVAVDGVDRGEITVGNNGAISITGLSISSGSHILSVVPDSVMPHTVMGTEYGFNSYVGFSIFTV